jgi:hypothetical protein
MPSEKRFKTFRYHNSVRWKSRRRGALQDAARPAELGGDAAKGRTYLEKLVTNCKNACGKGISRDNPAPAE